MKAIADWSIYLVYSALWRVLRIIPEKSAYQLFSNLGERAYRRNGKRVRRLRSNYAAVRPKANKDEIEELVKGGLQSSMRYWCDTFRISDWSSERVASTVSTVNGHLFYGGAKSGRGIIVALPHAGNWDHAGLFFCSQGVKVHTVAEHLKPERLFRKFLAHREAMGMTVLDIDNSVINQLELFLNQGLLVALVADRDLSRSAIEVEFFNRKSRMPAGPALLALRTNADLITAYVSFVGDGIKVKFKGPFEVRRDQPEKEEINRITQSLADAFAEDINEDPTSWHMQQRIFIDDEDFRERSETV